MIICQWSLSSLYIWFSLNKWPTFLVKLPAHKPKPVFLRSLHWVKT